MNITICMHHNIHKVANSAYCELVNVNQKLQSNCMFIK